AKVVLCARSFLGWRAADALPVTNLTGLLAGPPAACVGDFPPVAYCSIFPSHGRESSAKRLSRACVASPIKVLAGLIAANSPRRDRKCKPISPAERTPESPRVCSHGSLAQASLLHQTLPNGYTEGN